MNATDMDPAETMRVVLAVKDPEVREQLLRTLLDHPERICVSTVQKRDRFAEDSLVAMLAETAACDADFLIHASQPGQRIPDAYEHCFGVNPDLVVISLDEQGRESRVFTQEIVQVEPRAGDPAKLLTDLVQNASA